ICPGRGREWCRRSRRWSSSCKFRGEMVMGVWQLSRYHIPTAGMDSFTPLAARKRTSQETWQVGLSGGLSHASLARLEAQMKIVISGAGPAGLTAAYWLRRYGFSATIVERAPSLLVGGYKIDVRGAALQVLRQMGIHDAVVAAHTDMQSALLVDKE